MLEAGHPIIMASTAIAAIRETAPPAPIDMEVTQSRDLVSLSTVAITTAERRVTPIPPLSSENRGIIGETHTHSESQQQLTLIEETLEMSSISDMLNEEEFVRVPHTERLKQVRQFIGSDSIDTVNLEVQLGGIQGDSESATGELTINPESVVEPSDSDTNNGGSERNRTTDSANSNNNSPTSDLIIVEDHFHEDAEDEAEDEGENGNGNGTGSVEPDANSYRNLSISPPSVGNVPSSTPPPTYAECMKDAIPLSFIDFWPQCISLNDDNFLYSRFETFERVVDAANLWLKEHPNIVIRNCETTEVKAASLDEYILNTAAKVSTFRSSFRPLLYVRGLRIWYSSKIINKLPFSFAVTPCMLRYKNVKPTLVNTGDHLEYEPFSSLVERLNEMLRGGSVVGRILSVESVCIKEPDVQEVGRIPLVTDPDESTWRDSYSKTARYILRVFYLPEQPSHASAAASTIVEKLLYKDFLPETRVNSRGQRRFREFTTAMDDCRLWLVHLAARYRLVNAQTLEVKLASPSQAESLNTNATFFSDYEGSPRVRYVRVYYAEDTTDPQAEYGVPLLSHKTFIPVPLKKRRHETLASLMHRVETWLRATGATVVCAETLSVLEQRCTDKKDADFSLYKSEWMEANTEYDHEALLYVVRVYLDTVYPEPPPQIFLDGEEDALDEDCSIL